MVNPLVPFLPAQHAMFAAQVRDQNNPAFLLSQILWIDDVSDVDQLRRAVTTATREVFVMRSSIRRDESGEVGFCPEQVDPGSILTLVDFTDDDDPRAALDAWRTKYIHEPLPLMEHAVGRHALLIVGGGRVGYYSAMHHTAIDGFGGALIMMRIIELYARFRHDEPASPSPFPDYRTVVENARVTSNEVKAFWQSYLATAPDRITFSPSRANAEVDPLVYTNEVKDLRNVSHGSWIHRCFAAVASYYTRTLDVPESLIGTPRANRQSKDERATPTMFMTTLPIRVRIDPTDTVGDVIAHVRTNLAQTARHSTIELNEPASMPTWAWLSGRTYGPLVNVIPFSVQPTVAGIDCELEFLGRGPVDDMSLQFTPSGQHDVTLTTYFNPRLYSPDEAALHVRRLSAHVQAWAEASPDTCVSELPFLLTEDTTAASWEPGQEAYSELRDASTTSGWVFDQFLKEPDLQRFAEASTAGALTLSVVDRAGRLVPIGGVGVVTVSGAAREQPLGGRLVRVTENGWRFAGHVDHQIRVRGALVNLDQQAALALSHASVREVRCNPDTASLVVRTSPRTDVDEIRRALKPLLQRGVRLVLTDK